MATVPRIELQRELGHAYLTKCSSRGVDGRAYRQLVEQWTSVSRTANVLFQRAIMPMCLEFPTSVCARRRRCASLAVSSLCRSTVLHNREKLIYRVKVPVLLLLLLLLFIELLRLKLYSFFVQSWQYLSVTCVTGNSDSHNFYRASSKRRESERWSS